MRIVPRRRQPFSSARGANKETTTSSFQSGVEGTPESDQSQERVYRHPWPEKGVLGRDVRLQRPVLGSEVPGRGLRGAEHPGAKAWGGVGDIFSLNTYTVYPGGRSGQEGRKVSIGEAYDFSKRAGE